MPAFFYGKNCFGRHNHMRQKRLLYAPGMISLLALPLLLIFLMPEDPKRHNAIRFFLPHDEQINKRLLKVRLDTYPASDEFETARYNAKKAFVEQELARLQFTNDTTHALQIRFGDEVPYEDVIHFINLCIVYEVNRYVLIDDCLYIFANDPPLEPQALGELPLDEVAYFGEPYKPSKWEISLNQIKYYWEETKYCITQNPIVGIAFVLLIVLPAMFRLFQMRSQHPRHFLVLL